MCSGGPICGLLIAIWLVCCEQKMLDETALWSDTGQLFFGFRCKNSHIKSRQETETASGAVAQGFTIQDGRARTHHASFACLQLQSYAHLHELSMTYNLSRHAEDSTVNQPKPSHGCVKTWGACVDMLSFSKNGLFQPPSRMQDGGSALSTQTRRDFYLSRSVKWRLSNQKAGSQLFAISMLLIALNSFKWFRPLNKLGAPVAQGRPWTRFH